MQLPFSNEEILEAVNYTLDGKINEYIHSHGGNIKILRVENEKVFVKLEGSCSGCSSSAGTLKNLIEKEIKRMIHPDLIVEQAS